MQDVTINQRLFINNEDTAIDYASKYLTFTAIDDCQFKISSKTSSDIYYSLDNGVTWSTIANNTNTSTVNSGKSILWKATNPTTMGQIDGIGIFSSTGTFNVSGNIMSLIGGDSFKNSTSILQTGQFAGLFNGAKIINAKNLILPATTLTQYCYITMFGNCQYLITAPKILPATTLTSDCYNTMFSGCTSLTSAPKLPATTLANGCYRSMFEGCIQLIMAPELPATSLVSNCYYKMFYNCSKLNYIKALFTTTPTSLYTNSWLSSVSSEGTFIKNSNASWTNTGVSSVPTGWTVFTSQKRLLYSLYNYSTEGDAATAIDTGVRLFDGSLSGYEIQLDAYLNSFDDIGWKDFICCYDNEANENGLHIQGYNNESDKLQFTVRPILSGNGEQLSVIGDGFDRIDATIKGNNSKLYYDISIYQGDSISSNGAYITGTSVPKHSNTVLIGMSLGGTRTRQYTSISINSLRIFEIDIPT